MQSLKGKVILVTGSAVRIGRAISKSLSSANLILHYHSSEKEALSLKNEIPNSKLFKADLTKKPEVESLIEFIQKEYGQLDVLINSASNFIKKPFLEVDDFDASLDLNLKAPLSLIQKAAFLMKENSSIINVCDIMAKHPVKNHSIHGMSKAALMYMAKSLAIELSPKIRINNLMIGAALPSSDYTAEKLELIIQKHVLTKKKITLEDIAKSVLFLIENPSINGSTLELDGGWV